MTPLAYQVTKQLTIPIKKRWINDGAGLLTRMDDVHCFELSEVSPLIDELVPHIRKGGLDERLTFLPAPKTWIEVRRDGSTVAWHLEEMRDDKTQAVVSSVFSHKDSHFGSVDNGILRLGTPQQPSYTDLISGPQSAGIILAALALINTPRIIGRVTHTPHRGLERRLLAMRSAIGKFPLHAWTEIKLKVHAPQLSDEEVEGHYTGERALHFCRSHLRVRYGKVEIVRSHWRGDASRGIKQSRYKLTAGG